MYRHFADTGRFQECSTGKVWPVAAEKDNAALEAAYLQARHTPDQELLVSVKGQVAPRPRMEPDPPGGPPALPPAGRRTGWREEPGS